jgi:hypothetical protein
LQEQDADEGDGDDDLDNADCGKQFSFPSGW